MLAIIFLRKPTCRKLKSEKFLLRPPTTKGLILAQLSLLLCVTCHMSQVACHMSYVMFHNLIQGKLVELIVEGSVIIEAYRV